LGIGLGILFHSVYCLLGLGLLLAESKTVFFIAKCAGAAYLAWIGLSAFRSRVSPPADRAAGDPGMARPEAARAVLAGFLTNALNPKAAFFFLALFSLVVSPQTPLWLRSLYCLWMAATTFLWFAAVSFLFTRERVRRRFLSLGPWLGRILGTAFLALAAKLVFAVAR
jgi:threonine/homoserine/homoserine lactone efflux protein